MEQFSAAQREASGVNPGATAAFPYDRMTVERFRAAFPRARWRDDLCAWFVPGISAERRLNAWSSREWSGVLAHADERGRDAFTFDPVTSPYLEVADDLVVRTPYSRDVVAELRQVPWARWDPASKAWRVPFRSFEELRRRWLDSRRPRAGPSPRSDGNARTAAGRPLGMRIGGPRPPNVGAIGTPCTKMPYRRSDRY
jgi:hypothetical protein